MPERNHMRGVVFIQQTTDALLTGRTWRMLSSAGATRIDCVHWKDVPAALAHGDGPVWIARAGTWQPAAPLRRMIPPSATGRPLVGFGHGGPSLYLEKSAAKALSEILRAGATFDIALQKLGKRTEFRCVPLHDIDVSFDSAPRAVQVVTSIQMGGAERVALDLAQEFIRAGWRTALAALGSPTRRAYPAPPFFADLSKAGIAPENRADALHEFALSFGADVLHAHLITAREAEAIRARSSVPLAITIHNAVPIWPEGWMESNVAHADLLIGCAEAVSLELESRFPGVPVRTVWNGINAARYAPTPANDQAGARLREQLGWDPQDFVMLCVANPRPQKRLHRLPEIVACLDELIAPRRVRLLLAGEPASSNPAARECMDQFYEEVDRWHSRKMMHWSGAVDDLGPLLAASDAFIAVSSQEGLSLAQLEAVAAGLPVVATDVGGTREVATRCNRLSLLKQSAAAESFATLLAVIAHAPPPRTPALPPDFTHDVMARRCQLHLLGLLASRIPRPVSPSESAWLITNNFTTGGAQSSARRLLAALHSRGHDVRAATLEEFADRPTHGTKSLREAGVPVSNIRPCRDARTMVAQLLEELAAHPPRAILFWNVMPPVKVLLADVLHGIPIYDVSPGEMLFQSLDRFFAARNPGLPVESAREYGSRLAGVIVKYSGESSRAASALSTRVHVIRNGILSAPPVSRAPGKTFVLGTLARISPDKRLDQLIEAFRLAVPRMPLCRLRIGGGPDGNAPGHLLELKQLARGLPIEWCGEIKDASRFFASLDLFAMISEPAGCPNASLEAMSSGLAVIATDHGGVAEQVIDNVTGRMVPRGDVESFAEALVQLATDPLLRSRLAQSARAHVQAEFSLDRMVHSYERIIGFTPA
jgi:glycosyltransferase involved in cell wall biosynthesis